MFRLDICTNVGVRVSALREAQGMTQVELATLLGVDQSNVAQIESGSRNLTLKTVQKLASCLGTTVADFFDDDAFREPETPPHVARAPHAYASTSAAQGAITGGAALDDRIVAAIRANPGITMGCIATTLRISRSTAQRAFGRLRDAGRVRRVGSTRAGHWEVAD